MNTTIEAMAPQRINSNVTIYVRKNGNDSRTLTQCQTNTDANALATLAGAFILLNKYTFATDIMVTIQLENISFPCTSQITLHHPQGHRIAITGTTAAGSAAAITDTNTTTLDFTGASVSYGLAIYSANSISNINNIYIKGGNSGSINAGTGISCWYGGMFGIGGKVRVEYWTIGMLSQRNGYIYCNGGYFANNSNSNIAADYGGSFDLNVPGPITITGGGWGVNVRNSSACWISNVVGISNCANGVASVFNSAVSIGGASITNITGNALYAFDDGYIYSYNSTISGTGNALYASQSGMINSQTSTITGTVSPASGVIGNNNGFNYVY